MGGLDCVSCVSDDGLCVCSLVTLVVLTIVCVCVCVFHLLSFVCERWRTPRTRASGPALSHPSPPLVGPQGSDELGLAGVSATLRVPAGTGP